MKIGLIKAQNGTTNDLDVFCTYLKIRNESVVEIWSHMPFKGIQQFGINLGGNKIPKKKKKGKKKDFPKISLEFQ